MKRLIFIAFMVAIAGCISGGNPGPAEGRIVVGITDDLISAESVSSVKITVDSVSVHSVEADGWITISNQARVYDLVELNQQAATKILADAVLDAGAYNQLRLDVSNVDVTINGTTQTAVLPSSELRIPVEILIEENAQKASAVVLDFKVDRSLHTTGAGRIIMVPVIALRSSADADITVDAAGNMEIQRDRLVQETTVGTAVSGEIGVGLGVDPAAKLDIGVNGRITGALQNEERRPQRPLVYLILADDNGFYNSTGSEVEAIAVPRGSRLKIRFNTTEDVYYGGLDIRSEIFTSPTVEPKNSWTSPEFTMGDTFTITSYWPVSDIKKADLTIVAS